MFFSSLVLFTNRELKFADSSLQSEQVLLELRLLLFKDTDLALELLVFCPLIAKILLKIILNSSGFLLKIFSNFLCFYSEYIF